MTVLENGTQNKKEILTPALRPYDAPSPAAEKNIKGKKDELEIYIQLVSAQAPSLTKPILVFHRNASTALIYPSSASSSLTGVLLGLALACLT